MASVMRDEAGLRPNAGAIATAFGGYAAGVALIMAASPWLNAIGVLTLTIALTVTAYLIHDCAHSTLFRNSAHNALLGELLGWIAGSCYTPFESIRRKHLIHHSERVDNVSVDYRPILRHHPRAARVIKALEWCHVPAVDVMMHGLVIAAPFMIECYRRNRPRVITCLLVRGAAFAVLGWYAPKALVLYVVSYLLFLHILRFVDAFQHTYELEIVDSRDDLVARLRPGKDYEDSNTFSNPFSTRWQWLNLLTLNFVYHNAHHVKPSEPWYRLPVLHSSLYGAPETNTLPFTVMLRNYHHYRVSRILNDYGGRGRGLDDPYDLPGAFGLSFLTQV